jgi:hypothetical protein
MAEEQKNAAGEPEINATAVNLADLVDDEELIEEEEPEVEEEEEKEPEKGSLDDLMGDIFAEEAEEDDHLKAFGDLEHLTMVEVSSEVEAVLEELRIRQGSSD